MGPFQRVEDVEQCLGSAIVEVRDLEAIWRSRAVVEDLAPVAPAAGQAKCLPWLQHDAELARSFLRHALKKGAFLLAYEMGEESLRLYPHDSEIQRQLAVALLRLGSFVESRSCLEGLLKGLALDDAARALTWGLIGDCLYYEALALGAEGARQEALASSFEAYEKASLIVPNDFCTKIRAASVALLLGQTGRAEVLALEGLDSTKLNEQSGAETSILLLLETANAHCVLGNVEVAMRTWIRATKSSDATPHLLSRAKRHARELARIGLGAPGTFDSCFPPLRLVVFSGHMFDAPGSPSLRFPELAEHEAQLMLREKIEEIGPCACFASAAAGADLLFLEELHDYRWNGSFRPERHVVLPWARDAFLKSSVLPSWGSRFEQLLASVDSVKELGAAQLPQDNAGFEYTNLVMGGMALLEARTQGLELVPMVFWDGNEGRPGGTGSFVEFWNNLGREPVHVSSVTALQAYCTRINRKSLAPQSASVPSRRALSVPAPSNARGRTLACQVKTLLFADVVGYSKLPESVIPAYVEHFLGLVSRLVANSTYSPITVNTWGDALYFVFDEAVAGGMFALELADSIAQTPWERLGVYWEDGDPPIRKPLALRTGLHTGPVYVHFDPIVSHLSFTGAHVSRAARIEPITPSGQIYASEEFAAAAATDPDARFACDFVGTLNLAKKYPGQFRLFRVRPTRTLDIEELGQRIHENYIQAQLRRGDLPQSNASLAPWELLADDIRHENRAQAEHIKSKLHALGYDLIAGPNGAQLGRLLASGEVEQLARWEHERWLESLKCEKWQFAPVRDNAKKLHPCLVDWENLPEVEREKNREFIRAIPRLLELAGLQARRLDTTKALVYSSAETRE